MKILVDEKPKTPKDCPYCVYKDRKHVCTWRSDNEFVCKKTFDCPYFATPSAWYSNYSY